MKRLVFLMIVGTALWFGYQASNPPTLAAGTTAATVAALNTPATAGAKFAARMGRLGSRVAGPLVRSMTRDTERLLNEITPLIPKAKPREAAKAREVSQRILATDSAALVRLQEGHPMQALKLAFDARGLIPAVRQHVAEEKAFQ